MHPPSQSIETISIRVLTNKCLLVINVFVCERALAMLRERIHQQTDISAACLSLKHAGTLTHYGQRLLCTYVQVSLTNAASVNTSI